MKWGKLNIVTLIWTFQVELESADIGGTNRRLQTKGKAVGGPARKERPPKETKRITCKICLLAFPPSLIEKHLQHQHNPKPKRGFIDAETRFADLHTHNFSLSS